MFKLPKITRKEIEQFNDWLIQFGREKTKVENKAGKSVRLDIQRALLPLTYALFKSQSKLNYLTIVLIVLTFILAIMSVVLIYMTGVLICKPI